MEVPIAPQQGGGVWCGFCEITLASCCWWTELNITSTFQELELYKPELVSKPAILILNKIDTEGADKIADVTVEKVKAMKGIYSVNLLRIGQYKH